MARWQSWLHPFLAMAQVMDPPTELAGLTPAQGYAVAMLIGAGLLNLWSMARLRVWNPSGEPIIQPDAADEDETEKQKATVHAAPGAVRHVWPNPVLWREMATRAYGRKPLLVKLAYLVVVALVGYYALFLMQPRPWAAAYGLVPVCIISLLLISAQAVTAITSERDLVRSIC